MTVTDANGCTATSAITIAQPPVLTATANANPATCNGAADGSVSVSAGGGSPNYSYAWTPGGAIVSNPTGLTAGSYSVTVTDANGCTITTSATITQPTLLTTSINSSPALCNGAANGSAQVTPAGGTPNYSYTWFPSGGSAASATGLSAGSYSVTVTDANGCSASTSIAVTEPTPITLGSSTTPATCGSNNGSVTVNASGGAGAFTYSWSPSGGSGSTASGLGAGPYTATVTDANGCTSSITATVSNLGGPAVGASVTANVSCNGGTNGTALATVASGNGPYSYSWSPSGGTAATATNLSAGNYSVAITDVNGCTSVANIAVTEPTALAAQASSNNTSCNGSANGSVSVNVAGGSPGYSYLWMPGNAIVANPGGLTAGSYTVTVTDANGCTTTANATVGQPPVLSASTSSVPALCNGAASGSAAVTASGGTPTFTYSWFPSGGAAANESNLSAGSYTVTVTDANGCTTSSTVAVTEPTAINLTSTTSPATCGSLNGSASVTAAGGASPYTYSWSPSGGTAGTASNIGAGAYTVTVSDAHSCTSTATASVSSLGGPTVSAVTNADVSCFGGSNGSAAATASNGTGPFTYAWAPTGGNAATASNLSAGTYSVSVTDARTSVASATVSEPIAITAQATSNSASCNGSADGSAGVNVAGGSPNYSYNWMPGNSTSMNPSGLAAGNYTVTVTDANGCTTTAATTVSQPAAISATVSPAAAHCNGSSDGSAQVTASGGTPGYTYNWFPSGGAGAIALNLSAGNYSVTVTDANGCTHSASTTVNQPAAINLVTSSSPATCGSANGTAGVTVSGGASPYSYAWTPAGGTGMNASGLAAGSYSVQVTDANGCTSSAAANVSNTGGPTIIASVVNNVSCNGGSNGNASVAVSSGTGPFNYQWSPSGGTGTNASNLPAGNYSVTVIDANGCISSSNVTITEPSILSLQASSTDATCAGYANGSASVQVAGGVGPYSYSWSPGGANTANASNLTAGNYTVTVTDANGCTQNTATTISQPTPLVTSISSTPSNAQVALPELQQ
ncbi:MAG: SprB repeat-containing protein [Bacteroidetes bacterium]|nr:SprB repeat-containing protein [Bacteroidota bacterium]